MIKTLYSDGVAIARCASLSSAWGQAAVCPRIGVGELTPLDNGQEAGRGMEYAAAARFYEQHLACVEQARPGVRDHINATAPTRTAQA